MKSHLKLCLAVTPVLGIGLCASQAAPVTWDGGTTGTGSAWATATNWSGNVNPTLNDTVLFNLLSVGAIPTAMSLSGGNTICQSVTFSSGFNATNTSLVQNNSGSGTASIIRLYGDANGILLDFQPSAGQFTIQNGTSTTVTQNLNTQIHNSGTINVNTGGTLSILGAFNNSTAAGFNATPVVTKTGGGKFVLGSTASTFTGSYVINAGTVSINSGSSLGNPPGAPTTNITFSGNSALQTTGVGNIINVNRSVVINSGVTATLDVVGSLLTVNATISGDGSLKKTGAGRLILTNTNSYAGTTAIEGGVLSVNGTHSGGGDYTVGNSGILGGSGIITLASGKSVFINPGGTLAPGNSAGLLSVFGTVDLANDITSTLEMELGGNPLSGGVDFDVLSVDGTIDVAGSRLNILLPGGVESAQLFSPYTIVTATGGVTGNFAMLNDQLGGSSYTNGVLPYDVTYNANSIQITFIPEPASMILVSTAAVLMQRRRLARS